MVTVTVWQSSRTKPTSLSTLRLGSSTSSLFTTSSRRKVRSWGRIVQFLIGLSCKWLSFPFSPVSSRVRWSVCIGGVIGRGARGDRPPEPWVAHSAHSLPGPSSLFSHYLLLPHLQCSSQTLGETCKCWQGPTRPPANTQGEKHTWIVTRGCYWVKKKVHDCDNDSSFSYFPHICSYLKCNIIHIYLPYQHESLHKHAKYHLCVLVSVSHGDAVNCKRVRLKSYRCEHTSF